MNLTYDSKRDVLYLYYGNPRPAISEEIEPGCLIRRDFETNEVVGVTVIGFAQRGQWQLPRLQTAESADLAVQSVRFPDAPV